MQWDSAGRAEGRQQVSSSLFLGTASTCPLPLCQNLDGLSPHTAKTGLSQFLVRCHVGDRSALCLQAAEAALVRKGDGADFQFASCCERRRCPSANSASCQHCRMRTKSNTAATGEKDDAFKYDRIPSRCGNSPVH